MQTARQNTRSAGRITIPAAPCQGEVVAEGGDGKKLKKMRGNCALPSRVTRLSQRESRVGVALAAYSVRSGVGAQRRSGVVFSAGRRKHKRCTAPGMQGKHPQMGSLERMGINKGKGLSVPSPYFDLWLLSVEAESNKRPILFA